MVAEIIETQQPTFRQTREGRYCRWCGTGINSDIPDDYVKAEYCNSKHARSAQRNRHRRRSKTLYACPTPAKRNYYDRGEVIVWGAIYGHYGYSCRCGFYHLSSSPPRPNSDDNVITELIQAKVIEMSETEETKSAQKTRHSGTISLGADISALPRDHDAIDRLTRDNAALLAGQQAIWKGMHDLADTIKAQRAQIDVLEQRVTELSVFTSSEQRDTINANDNETTSDTEARDGVPDDSNSFDDGRSTSSWRRHLFRWRD